MFLREAQCGNEITTPLWKWKFLGLHRMTGLSCVSPVELKYLDYVLQEIISLYSDENQKR